MNTFSYAIHPYQSTLQIGNNTPTIINYNYLWKESIKKYYP